MLKLRFPTLSLSVGAGDVGIVDKALMALMESEATSMSGMTTKKCVGSETIAEVVERNEGVEEFVGVCGDLVGRGGVGGFDIEEGSENLEYEVVVVCAVIV